MTTEYVGALYVKYQDSLCKVRDAQRQFLRDRGKSMKAQLDDYEAEITYLLLRELRPDVVTEIGTFYGWSTRWILSALRDNGNGHLHSFDIVDNVVRNVPAELAGERWTFTMGDVRENLAKIPARTDYLFIDADHGARFAHWYIDNLFPAVPAGTPTSVHDVFHGRRPKPLSEGSVIVKWLAETGIECFTPSTAKAPQVTAELAAVKKRLGLDEPVRVSDHNPMIFFNLP
ncbi:class I SAM-dependent methyltransferase [Streptomyces sp. NPDC048434]|uniref:class I SAM-dependent methyltransferase n=1 Tax=Streptomyces sp. NPDC048434 TaxID=3365549 RepID=UPI003714D1C6